MHQNNQPQQFDSQILNEGLKADDLKGFVEHIITIDTYQSKMGEDKDVAVVGFRVKDRLPALDLMEFIERGYGFVLDADISSGEESDGKYSVFVELERNRRLPENIEKLLSGVGHLVGETDWRYRYYKEFKSKPISLESLQETVPCTSNDYETHLQESRLKSVKKFLVQSAYDKIELEGTMMTFKRPFGGDLVFEIRDIGDYKTVMAKHDGEIKLDEQAQAEMMYLNKLFGDYEIIKLGDSFLVKNDTNESLLLKPRL
jgi:hypothetical protein